MNRRTELASLLAHFPAAYQPSQIRALGNAGGYSGAQFWQLHTADGTYCLRRWPSESQRSRLNWIHEVVVHVGCGGLHEVPVPLANAQGQRGSESAVRPFLIP